MDDNVNKYFIGDFVTVKDAKVWYTWLDDMRLKLVGKTGRIVSVEEQTFTAEEYNKEQPYHSPNAKAVGYHKPDDWTQTIFNYYVVFPDEPDKRINFSEAFLEPFKQREN